MRIIINLILAIIFILLIKINSWFGFLLIIYIIFYIIYILKFKNNNSNSNSIYNILCDVIFFLFFIGIFPSINILGNSIGEFIHINYLITDIIMIIALFLAPVLSIINLYLSIKKYLKDNNLLNIINFAINLLIMFFILFPYVNKFLFY